MSAYILKTKINKFYSGFHGQSLGVSLFRKTFWIKLSMFYDNMYRCQSRQNLAHACDALLF